MKITLGEGIYTPVRALLICDSRFESKELLQDYAFDKAISPNDQAADNRLNRYIAENLLDKLDVDIIKMNPSRTYGCPGYLYAETSIQQLRKFPVTTALYVELDDRNNHRICLIYHLRAIGYGIDIPPHLKGDAIQEFLDLECQMLIMMPGLTCPEEPDFPEYTFAYSGKGCQYVSYTKPIVTKEQMEISGN